jgi:hypothetical protein
MEVGRFAVKKKEKKKWVEAVWARRLRFADAVSIA